MTDLLYYPSVQAWWAQLDARHYRITRRFTSTATRRYTARCGDFKARATTLRAAVAICAMRCARPRDNSATPFDEFLTQRNAV